MYACMMPLAASLAVAPWRFFCQVPTLCAFCISLQVLLSARAVAVVGGTMGSMKEFVDQLLTPKLAELKVSTFSCGHVVDGRNLLALTAAQTAAREPFRFTFANRRNLKVCVCMCVYVCVCV